MSLTIIILALIGIFILFTLIKWFMKAAMMLVGIAICLWLVWQFVPASHGLFSSAVQWTKTAWTHGRQIGSDAKQANKTANQVHNAMNQLEPLVNAAKEGLKELTNVIKPTRQ